VFPDVLRGLAVAEELIDTPPAERQMGMVDEVKPAAASPAPAAAALPDYPQDRFDANIEQWRAVVQSGKKTADALIAMLSTKGVLSGDQIAVIRSFENFEPAADASAAGQEG
jgi:hypothetical protein